MNDRVHIDEIIVAQDRMLQLRKENYDFKEELRQQKLRIDQLEQKLNQVNETISNLIRLL